VLMRSVNSFAAFISGACYAYLFMLVHFVAGSIWV
jgi:hypothetical protein